MKKWSIKSIDKRIWLIIRNVTLVLVSIMVGLFANGSKEKLYSQSMADRWQSEDTTYAQVSAFLSPGMGANADTIKEVRSSLAQKLKEDSLNEAKEGARVWVDAYSGECEVSLRYNATTLSVMATGVSDDFFLFHPMKLLSGNYITSEDLNKDRIVVDENFAWAMFGSNNIAGMKVWFGDTIYTIAGVVAVEEDALYRAVYGENNRVYMSYETLQKQQGVLNITCYEAVLPNPLTNYAYYSVRSAFGLEEEAGESDDKKEAVLNFGDVEVIENSNRYDLIPLYKQFRNKKYRVMRTSAIGYPMWENLARVEEDRQINMWMIRILLLVVPMVSLVRFLYHLWKKKTWTVKGILLLLFEKLKEVIAARRERLKKDTMLGSDPGDDLGDSDEEDEDSLEI